MTQSDRYMNVSERRRVFMKEISSMETALLKETNDVLINVN